MRLDLKQRIHLGHYLSRGEAVNEYSALGTCSPAYAASFTQNAVGFHPLLNTSVLLVLFDRDCMIGTDIKTEPATIAPVGYVGHQRAEYKLVLGKDRVCPCRLRQVPGPGLPEP